MEKLTTQNRVFIGSSTEGKPFAEKIINSAKKLGLSPLAWFDFFKDSRPPLQELEHLTLRADAAILIATSDDKAIIREKKWHQMRDNVLFEYGLFAGTIGRAKCGLILPNTEDFRIPSDFLGVACFETFDGINIEEAAEKTVQSLVDTLKKPPKKETIKQRGKRLLHLIGWIRDETLRLVQDWDSRYGRRIAGDRIVAVSAFLRDDIDNLLLREEYNAVEKIILDGINAFPAIDHGRIDRYEMRHAMEAMVRGHVKPNPEVLEGLLYMFREVGIPFDPECDRECYRYWRHRSDWPRYSWHDDYPWYRYKDMPFCGPTAYAAGAAEAASVFERMSASPIPDLKAWSNKFIGPLNEAVAKFERKLHEEMFGEL